jgi:adenylate cyclase
MKIEIERKFLVVGDFKSQAVKSYLITQGYLCSVPERTVRVRIMDTSAFLTIKGKSNLSGLSRFEWEKEIALNEAKELMKICEPGIIEKKRYKVVYQGQLYEVDEFFGENEGLILAEIELENENTTIIKPDWLGEEVTGKAEYYNAMLRKNPYRSWKK